MEKRADKAVVVTAVGLSLPVVWKGNGEVPTVAGELDNDDSDNDDREGSNGDLGLVAKASVSMIIMPTARSNKMLQALIINCHW